jgi:hypothetical protein
MSSGASMRENDYSIVGNGMLAVALFAAKLLNPVPGFLPILQQQVQNGLNASVALDCAEFVWTSEHTHGSGAKVTQGQSLLVISIDVVFGAHCTQRQSVAYYHAGARKQAIKNAVIAGLANELPVHQILGLHDRQPRAQAPHGAGHGAVVLMMRR